MKKYLLTALAALTLALPLTNAWAGDDMHGMNAASEQTTIMLETSPQEGVAAMAHLYDVREAMAKHGMKETHHMMVMFTDTKDGKPITDGTVAFKIIDPSGTKGGAIKTMLMGDGFGADVALTDTGTYNIEVGTKLADGKKRVFPFTYTKK